VHAGNRPVSHVLTLRRSHARAMRCGRCTLSAAARSSASPSPARLRSAHRCACQAALRVVSHVSVVHPALTALLTSRCCCLTS
jgi:hypothetical protein